MITRWSNSLMFRLVTYFLLISLASTIAVGALSYYLARESLTQSVFDRLTTIANLKESELKRWVNEQTEEVVFIADTPELQTAVSQLVPLVTNDIPPTDPAYQALHDDIQARLVNLANHKESISEIFILTSVGGKIIVSTNPEHEGLYRVNDTYFRKGKFETFVQNVYPSPLTGKPAMTISTPLFDSEGKKIAVLAAHLNLSEMDEIVQTPESLAETGESYLVDKFNVFVSSERFGRIEFPRGVHTPAIDAAIQGKSGYGLYQNYQGEPVIGAYRWIGELELALLVEQNEAAALLPAQRVAITIGIVGGITALLLAIGVYLLARQIAQPILTLTETAVLVAEGNLSTLSPITSQDEIGLLATAFNKMITQLRTLYSGLENKIQELQQTEAALQRYAHRLETLHEIDRALLTAQSPHEIANAALIHIHTLIPCHRSSVTIFNFAENQAEIIAAHGNTIPGLLPGTKFSLENNSLLKDLQQGTPHVISSPESMEQDTSLSKEVLRSGLISYINFPLLWQNQLIGSLNLAGKTADFLNQENINIGQEIANQLAVAIRQTQLLEATQRQLKELSLLHAVALATTEATDENSLIEKATEAIGSILTPHNFGIMLIDETTGSLKVMPSYRGVPEKNARQYLPKGTGITGYVAQTGRPLRIGDVTQDPRYYNADPAVRSELCVPLIVNDHPIGIINIESTQKDAFSAEDETLLTTLAHQLALGIQKIRLFNQTQQEIERRRRIEKALREARDHLEMRVSERTAELTLLNRASQSLITSLNLEDVLTTVLEELRNLLDVVACSVWLLDEQTNELVCYQSSGPQGEQVRGWRLPANKGILGWAVQNKTSVLTHDAQQDTRHLRDLDEQLPLQSRSLLTLPLIIHGRVIGALQAIDDHPNRFTDSDRELLESLAATAAFAIENARLYNLARKDAQTKATLLKEVNHRVKNNLSAIIGLLYAERRHAKIKDEAIYQKIMNDLITRVQGLATVHNLLSASEWTPVLLTDLVNQLIHSTIRTLPASKSVNIIISPSPIRITAEQANYLALVLNELVTNSIKYAFNDRNHGQIIVNITQNQQNIRITYQDDGPGYPPDVLRAENPRHNVGFHLLYNIVRNSLNGTFTIQNLQNNGQTGAVAIIEFEQLVQNVTSPQPV
ncbi:MAG: GAF domain-containing protein [Chloroflexi bacterium]|nr:MAG: GAF domain-containing protein [Chloroflexota bacterium]